MKAAFYHGNKTFTVEAGAAISPQRDEVRINVAYCGVCGTDLHIYHGAMDQRVKTPAIIGHEMSGTVAEVGADVRDLNVGDPVVVRPLDTRGEKPADKGFSHICRNLKFLGIDSPGAFQSSWTVPAATIHRVPEGTDLRLAALAEPLAVACHDVRLGQVKVGELAVVLGGGPIGMLVALVAKSAGASVILSEVNPFRLELARKLNLEAINPLEENLVALCQERTAGSGADIVFEVSGAKSAVLSMTDCLAIRGRIVVVAIHPKPTEINLFQFFWKELKLCGARVYEPEDYEAALALLASGTLPLDELITRIESLSALPRVFESLDNDATAMKILVDCQS